jgi:hypothetical protein
MSLPRPDLDADALAEAKKPRHRCVSVPPRLRDVDAAGDYLGVSPWTVRALVAEGHLKPVRLPSVRYPGENGRRLLFDVRDLDAAVDKWKAR